MSARSLPPLPDREVKQQDVAAEGLVMHLIPEHGDDYLCTGTVELRLACRGCGWCVSALAFNYSQREAIARWLCENAWQLTLRARDCPHVTALSLFSGGTMGAQAALDLTRFLGRNR